MSRHEHEHEEEAEAGTVPREVQAGIEARRGGGSSLDAGVRDRLAPGLGDPLSDVRIHTDTGAGTLARKVSARAFATGPDVYFAPGEYRPGTTDGDRLLAHELAHVVQQRGAPTSGRLGMTAPGDATEREADTMAAAALQPRSRAAGVARAAGEARVAGEARAAGEARVARDLVDDVANLFGSSTEVERQPREAPVTREDFGQILGLVSLPLEVSKTMLRGDADVTKAAAAAEKLGPASSALHVIAASKKEARNRDRLYRPLDEIQAAITTLKVMAEPEKAKDIWLGHFEGALKVVEQILVLPIRDESKPDEGANPDETITQRDHDLLQVTVKTELEQLIKKVSGTPYSDWDPKTVQSEDTLLTSSAQFSNRKMNTVRTRIALGYQAINTSAMSLNQQQTEAVSAIESAQTALAQALAPYFESDPTDPKSPSYQPPGQPI